MNLTSQYTWSVKPTTATLALNYFKDCNPFELIFAMCTYMNKPNHSAKFREIFQEGLRFAPDLFRAHYRKIGRFFLLDNSMSK